MILEPTHENEELEDPGNCINCKCPRSLSRPYKSAEYEGVEYYCPNCPPEKWSKVVASPTSDRAKKSWDGIFQAVKEGVFD